MARSIRVKLVIVYLLLILFSLQLIGAYFVRSLTGSLLHNETQQVQAQTELIATMAAPEIVSQANSTSGEDGGGSSGVTSILSSLPQTVNGSAYVLNPQGVVIDTSAGHALIGQKRIDSVATQTLVSHTIAIAIRVDPLSGEHMLEVAVPMQSRGHFIGVAESVVPVQSIYLTVRQVTTIFYTASLVALLFTAALSIVLSRTISRPVLDVTAQARSMADGDYTQRVQVTSDDEFGDLGHAINDLAGRLQEALAANAREQERLAAILMYMGDGVIAFDSHMQLMFQNDVALRLLKQHDIPRREAAERLGLSTAEVQLGDNAGGAYIRQVGDALLHMHVTSVRRGQDIDGYVAIIRDVTEQERLTQSRRDFVANVSHELRTPLTTLRSYLEVLREGVPDDATARQFLGVVEGEAERMVRLTQDLLQLSGLDSHSYPYQEVEIELCSWLAAAVDRFRLQASAQGVELDLDCEQSALLQGDRDMLDRVLDNLLSNALKYTASGGRISLSSRLHPGHDAADIRICDNGIGIPEQDLPHVFERFYRVDKARSRRRGGSGLGLALAREMVELHGGRISIDSQVDVGTTVAVSLPLAGEESAC